MRNENVPELFARAAYELYKEDCKSRCRSYSPELEKESMRNYLSNSLAAGKLSEYRNRTSPYIFRQEYECEFNMKGRSDGVSYSSYWDFLENEFLDTEYMHGLLKDAKLIKEYDIARWEIVKDMVDSYVSIVTNSSSDNVWRHCVVYADKKHEMPAGEFDILRNELPEYTDNYEWSSALKELIVRKALEIADFGIEINEGEERE